MYSVYFIILIVTFGCIVNSQIDNKQLKCLVCQATIDEIENAVAKIDPKKMVEVGGYRFNPSGDTTVKTVPQVKSEIFLSELLDDICNKMDDYVRATWKSNGQLTLLRLMTASGQMNPDMSKVDIIQDGDLNKSLQYYCEGIVDDFEDVIIKHFKNGSDNIDIRVCSEEAKFCSHSLPEPDNDIFDDEL